MSDLTLAHPTCGACGFALHHPVTELRVSVVSLYDDARFPGRALVVLKTHREHLHALEHAERAAFLEDQIAVGEALLELTDATRVNYAVLGNAVPHVHAHVVPRREAEPRPHRTPWEHPADPHPLSPGARDLLLSRLRLALSR